MGHVVGESRPAEVRRGPMGASTSAAALPLETHTGSLTAAAGFLSSASLSSPRSLPSNPAPRARQRFAEAGLCVWLSFHGFAPSRPEVGGRGLHVRVRSFSDFYLTPYK